MMEFFELIGEVFDGAGQAAGLLAWLWVLSLLWVVFAAVLEHGRSSDRSANDASRPSRLSDPPSLGMQVTLAVVFFFIVAIPIWAVFWLALGLFDLDRAREQVFEFFILLLSPLVGVIVATGAFESAWWQRPIRWGLLVAVPVIAIAAFLPAVQAGVYWSAVSGLNETHRMFQEHDFDGLDYYPASAERAARTYLTLWPGSRHQAQAEMVLDELLWHSIDIDKRFVVGQTGRQPLESLAAYAETYPDGRHTEDLVARIDLQTLGELRRHLTKPAPEVFGRSVEEKIWALADQEDQRWAYARYNQYFPEGAFVAESRTRIEALDWEKTVDENTIEGYLAFETRYPDSDRTAIQGRIDDLRWRQATADNTIRHYHDFEQRFPDSPHVEEIEARVAALRVDDAVWDPVRRSATTEAIEQFLADYPGHKNEADAIELREGVEFRTLLARRQIEMDFRGCGIQAVCGALRNLTELPLRVRVPAGSLFVSSDPKAQSMSVVESSAHFLRGRELIQVNLSAACADIARDIPYEKVSFSFLPQGGATALSSVRDALDSDEATWHVRQAMVWIVRDNAGSGAITRRLQGAPIRKNDVTKALQLLQAVGYPVETRSAWRENQ